MNKRELVEAVAVATGLDRSAAGEAVEAVLEAVAAGLAAGEQVTVPGFGTFEVRERAARTAAIRARARRSRSGRRACPRSAPARACGNA